MKKILSILLMAAMLICLCSCGDSKETESSAENLEAMWQVGNTVTFGTYQQSKSGSDSTPIEWLVLARDGDKALVISKYVLDCLPYNTERTSVTWENCSLREWLNKDFYNKAFSAKEKKNIVNSKITAEKNPEYDTYAGRDTMDNVFLLSVTEAKRYFEGEKARRCISTDYAMENGVNIDRDFEIDDQACCWWWLRSPGYRNYHAAGVGSGGSVGGASSYVDRSDNGVRPCLWVHVFFCDDSTENKGAKSPAGSATGNKEKKSGSTENMEAKWQVGNTVFFGAYPQSAWGIDRTPVEWLVLARDGDKALVISKYALDTMPYSDAQLNHTWTGSSATHFTWDSGYLRKWLNNDFYNNVFGTFEKNQIITSVVTADPNPREHRAYGIDTMDNVFLLSAVEAKQYFKSDMSRMCVPTDYALEKGAYTNSAFMVDGRACCTWWLRTPGSYTTEVLSVENDGNISLFGEYVVSTSYCVRPCMWVRIFDEKEAAYKTAVERFENDDFEGAQYLFGLLGGYKDSKTRVGECEKAILKREYEAAKKLYTEGHFEEAKSAFKMLGTYSDSQAQVRNCEEAILNIEYEEAKALYTEGKYEEAKAAFEALGTYSDSPLQIINCEEAILNRDYEAAKKMYEVGRFDAAKAAFEKLGTYKDSPVQVAACEEATRNRDYKSAKILFSSGKYEEAKAAFEALGAYNDSPLQVTNCEEAIRNRDYEKAKILYAEGKYVEAYMILLTLQGYRDVDDMMQNDGNLLAAAFEAKWQIGQNVMFGSYPQIEDGAESTPIEWIVLARDGDKALVISRYALDVVPYNTEWTDVTWETCSLRTWLNNDFYNKAFNAEEKRNIVLSKVMADKNPKYSTYSGNDTEDNVFLLSIPEVRKYFKDESSRMCAPTDYAVKNDAVVYDYYKVDGRASCWWWLRSPGNLSDLAASVDPDGSVYYGGSLVDGSNGSVRPCVWVRLF